MKNGKLHVITNGKQSNDKLINIAKIIHPFIDAIHIREKAKTAQQIYHLVQQLYKNGVPSSKLIINDRVDVAQVCKVKGVQLAYHSLPVQEVKDSFPSLQVGCSCHSLEEGGRAQRNGAQYILFGHIFTSNSKPGVPPKGLKALSRVSRQLDIPVIAIGGITPKHVSQVMKAGASGIAVMSGVWEARDPLNAVQSYKKHLIDRGS
ncbi:thiazole tautomerase TenI [Salinibacillus xinjiangensis]|uniref:Thiazole tautomerase TenI n=1 Tax=Salinibacillus xinjiangensis TaxID=1229268 RepID=A0A6G1X574_9BACI|nr:thiazole tautomerase TenI [Salinibacillus xinjiangensis]MRG86153.1 thiazole tautomerase TenI [Salinibacillus xinjiangensis]